MNGGNGTTQGDTLFEVAALRDRARKHYPPSYGWDEPMLALIEVAEALNDLAFEGRINGLGDVDAEVHDPTGVLSRTRVALARFDFGGST